MQKNHSSGTLQQESKYSALLATCKNNPSPGPTRTAIDHALGQVEAALAELLDADYREPTSIKLLQTWLNRLLG